MATIEDIIEEQTEESLYNCEAHFINLQTNVSEPKIKGEDSKKKKTLFSWEDIKYN